MTEENRCEICGAYMKCEEEEAIGEHLPSGDYYFVCNNINNYKHLFPKDQPEWKKN